MTIQGRLVKEHSNDSPTDYGPVFDPKFYPEGSLSHAVMEVWKSKNPREALEKAMKERKREIQELEEEGAIYNSIKQLQKAKEEKRLRVFWVVIRNENISVIKGMVFR
jgi:hypothetical protein